VQNKLLKSAPIGLLLGVFLLINQKAEAYTGIQVNSELTGTRADSHFIVSYPTGSNTFGWVGELNTYPDDSNPGGGGAAGCSSYTNNICTADLHYGDITSSTFDNLWFKLYDNGNSLYYFLAFSNGTTTNNSRFIEPYTPTNGSFSSSTQTTFAASYFFNCSDFGSYDLVSFEIKDLTNPSFLPGTAPVFINICGENSYSNSVQLKTNDTYLWRPTMYSSAGSTTPIYGSWYSFLATSSPEYSPLPQTVGTATSTLPSAYNLLSFLNVPELLRTRIPFAYIFQIYAGIQLGISSSTGTIIPSGTMSYLNTRGSTTTQDMFSTTTIGYYLSPTLINLWRTFLLVVLYAEFGYALYNRLKPKEHNDLI